MFSFPSYRCKYLALSPPSHTPPAIELVGPLERTFTTVVMNVGYSCGLIILGGVVYFVRDWSHLALATTLPFLAFFFAFRLAVHTLTRWSHYKTHTSIDTCKCLYLCVGSIVDLVWSIPFTRLTMPNPLTMRGHRLVHWLVQLFLSDQW